MNLIVHPKEPTTQFLSHIYAPLQNKTVIDGGVTKSELRELIEIHDRVIMLGHGSPNGLMSVGQFPGAGFHIVDESMVELLKNKTNNINIWCHADQFVQKHGLSGLCSGMFVSEIEEEICYGFDDIDGEIIDESNKVVPLEESFNDAKTVAPEHFKVFVDSIRNENVLKGFSFLGDFRLWISILSLVVIVEINEETIHDGTIC